LPTFQELVEYAMATPLPIDKMTIEEKLQAMEALWNDLCQHEEALPVHDWQKEVLDERERQIERGEAQFVDWEEAKKRIAREIS
jgi:putative addiction module component (TIGR02574 family)